MTCWICSASWGVTDITVTVVALGVGRVGDEGVGAGEPAGGGDVVAGVHVDEAEVGGAEVVVLVAGVASIGQVGRWFGAPVAKGVIAGGAAINGISVTVAH